VSGGGRGAGRVKKGAENGPGDDDCGIGEEEVDEEAVDSVGWLVRLLCDGVGLRRRGAGGSMGDADSLTGGE
jgi:hypothetical protein